MPSGYDVGSMPIDQYEDDEEKGGGAGRENLKFKEFDCPSCNANNPCEEPFGEGDQLLCNYCGCEYDVRITEHGRPSFARSRSSTYGGRSPKIAVPTRTAVAPSSIATSKSDVVPIESSGIW